MKPENNKNQILCSTGALIGRPNNRNHKLLKEFVKELACDGYEFMMYDTWYEKVDEIVQDLQELGVNIPVMHCEKSIGERISQGGAENLQEAIRLFEINCKMAKRLSIRQMVIHLWSGVASDACFENNLKAYAALEEMAKPYGVELLVENVVCNRENPLTHWCELAEKYPSIRFVFDTKMAAFHRQEELLYEDAYAWLWKNGHIRHYHVNDYLGGYMDWGNLRTLPIGSGQIDFKVFFAFMKKIQYTGTYTVEATAFNKEGVVDLAMLNRCFETIRRYLSETKC